VRPTILRTTEPGSNDSGSYSSGTSARPVGYSSRIRSCRDQSSGIYHEPTDEPPGYMNARDLQRYKRLLLAKLAELSANRADSAPPAPGAGGPMGDLADQANADAEAGLHIRLRQGDVRLLRAIEDALARTGHDTFGVCEICKRDVSRARLEAVPWTRLCRECKDNENT
jgi:DnaK suppressor protein